MPGGMVVSTIQRVMLDTAAAHQPATVCCGKMCDWAEFGRMSLLKASSRM